MVYNFLFLDRHLARFYWHFSVCTFRFSSSLSSSGSSCSISSSSYLPSTSILFTSWVPPICILIGRNIAFFFLLVTPTFFAWFVSFLLFFIRCKVVKLINFSYHHCWLSISRVMLENEHPLFVCWNSVLTSNIVMVLGIIIHNEEI